MLLAIDIGNSSIKFGIFDEDQLTTKFSIPTKRNYSTEEISGQILDRLPVPIDAAIVCSVVPEVKTLLPNYINDSFNIEPRFVRSTDDFGLEINFSVETTGTDRLVNSFAVG